MDIDQLYHDIIQKLTQHSRARNILDINQSQKVIEYWSQSIKDIRLDKIRKVIAILSHSHLKKIDYEKVEQLIYQSFELAKFDDDLTIYLLSLSQNYLISQHKKNAKKIPMTFIYLIEKHLSSKNLEVVEWALRLTTELGNQSLFLKEKIVAIHFPLSSLFSPHRKNCKELQKFISSQW